LDFPPLSDDRIVLFTTYSYLAFVALIVPIHWALPSGRWRSVVLIAASLFFYTFTQGPLVAVLCAYVLLNWYAGLHIARRPQQRSIVVLVLLANIAPLFYYKYLTALALSASGLGDSAARVEMARWLPTVVPLGISFFSFQAAAYIVDVARGGAPIASLLDFAVFKTLWPQLVAGPIVRANELRDQLRTRYWDNQKSAAACGRLLNGLFKKVVLADSLAPIADQAFQAASPAFMDATFGTLAFGLQIYFDFSAYSDIAIATAALLGFHLPENFEWPYAACSPQDFWRRWHMTLSRWIRDYVFTPLAVHYRRNVIMSRLSIVAAMVLCGAWHGAGLTFMLWGFWHGLLLMLNATTLRKFYSASVDPSNRLRRLLAVSSTFVFVQIGWLFFRSDSLHQVGQMFGAIVSFRGGLHPAAVRENGILVVAVLWAAFLMVQIGRERLSKIRRWPTIGTSMPIIRALQASLIIAMHQNATTFVYFQF
jgi:alginate O-acetyltransferase complex protein AlgI